MFAEDLSQFFQTGDFADAAVYNGATTKNVLFERSYLDQYGVVAGARPVAYAPASEIPNDAAGKTLVIRGITYTIRSREPLDDGAVVLMKLDIGA